MNTIQRGIVLLLRSGITGEYLKLPEGFTLEEALPILKKHSVIPLAYQGAVNCGLDQKDQSMQMMLMVSYRNLMIHEKQVRTLERLFAIFEERGIPFLPVKGCNIKKLYPKPELRPMGDADILIRQEDYAQIRPIMEDMNFTQSEDTSHVYVWKNNDLLVELHKSLVDEREGGYYAYYGTGWDFAVPGETSRYHMRPEDAYIFTFVHFAKHYRSSGIGCRHMMDLYVYHRKMPELDMTYIRRELKKLELWTFHENVMNTLQVWFENRQEDAKTELITEFVFSSGNWGQFETKFLSRAIRGEGEVGTIKHAGAKTVVRTIFPTYRTMAFENPLLRKCPALLPVYWVRRWILILTVRRKSISGKLRILKQVNDTAVNAHKEALLAVGLVLDRKK